MRTRESRGVFVYSPESAAMTLPVSLHRRQCHGDEGDGRTR